MRKYSNYYIIPGARQTEKCNEGSTQPSVLALFSFSSLSILSSSQTFITLNAYHDVGLFS